MAHQNRGYSSEQNRGYSSDPDARGMWLRRRGAPERFPTFAGELPSVVSALAHDDPDDLALEDETEEVPRRAQVPVLGQPMQNREGATIEPVPHRTTRRPRPSPLFGEGELDAPYPARETLRMEARQSTLWETEITDAGQSAPAVDDWSPVGQDESITLEVDPQWRARIAEIDAEHAARAHSTGGSYADIEVVDDSRGYTSGAHVHDAGAFVAMDFGGAPAPGFNALVDDLSTDDLVYDANDFQNRRLSQTPAPSPLPRTEAEAPPRLAMRAPAPRRSQVPFPSPIVPSHPVHHETVGMGQRLVHAIEAGAWFALGAIVFSGTGSAVSLLVVAMLFAG